MSFSDTKPFSLFFIISRFPPASVTIQGFERLIASSNVIDVPSLKDDNRKTRLTLSDINSMRLASEDHDDQQKVEAEFVQKMYATPQADELAI